MSRKAGSGRWRSGARTRAPPLLAAHFQGQPVLVSFRLASTLANVKKQKHREGELWEELLLWSPPAFRQARCPLTFDPLAPLALPSFSDLPAVTPHLLPHLPQVAGRQRQSSGLAVPPPAGPFRVLVLLGDVGNGAAAPVQDVPERGVFGGAGGGGPALAAAKVLLLAAPPPPAVAGQGRGPGQEPVPVLPDVVQRLVHVHARVQAGVVAAGGPLALQLDDGVAHLRRRLPVQGDEPGPRVGQQRLPLRQLQQGPLRHSLQLAGNAAEGLQARRLVQSSRNGDGGFQRAAVAPPPIGRGLLAGRGRLQGPRLVPAAHGDAGELGGAVLAGGLGVSVVLASFAREGCGLAGGEQLWGLDHSHRLAEEAQQLLWEEEGGAQVVLLRRRLENLYQVRGKVLIQVGCSAPRLLHVDVVAGVGAGPARALALAEVSRAEQQPRFHVGGGGLVLLQHRELGEAGRPPSAFLRASAGGGGGWVGVRVVPGADASGEVGDSPAVTEQQGQEGNEQQQRRSQHSQ